MRNVLQMVIVKEAMVVKEALAVKEALVVNATLTSHDPVCSVVWRSTER